MEKKVIYNGTRIYMVDNEKDRDSIDYKESEVVCPCRFNLEDVLFVSTYINPVNPFTLQKRKDVIEVILSRDGAKTSFFIVEDFDVFTYLLDDLNKQ